MSKMPVIVEAVGVLIVLLLMPFLPSRMRVIVVALLVVLIMLLLVPLSTAVLLSSTLAIWPRSKAHYFRFLGCP
jgi:4-amino-4-deoxy-L-arabinose transferase-like glycosyltransferase